MKFFIPFADDKKQEQDVYENIQQFLSEELGAIFSDRKIFSLRYHHDGKKYYAEVGQKHSLNGEPVIAILYEKTRQLYHVCTPNRGLVRGGSILVGDDLVEEVLDFDSDKVEQYFLKEFVL